METNCCTYRAKVKRYDATISLLPTEWVPAYFVEMDIRKEVGQRLKRARQQKGMVLRQVCEQVPHLTESKLGNYERGYRMPDLDMLKLLANVLGTHAAYLATFDDDPIDPRERAVLDCFRQADQRGKDAILRTAELESRYTLTSTDDSDADCDDGQSVVGLN